MHGCLGKAIGLKCSLPQQMAEISSRKVRIQFCLRWDGPLYCDGVCLLLRHNSDEALDLVWQKSVSCSKVVQY